MEEFLKMISENGIIQLFRDWGIFAGFIWLIQHLITKSTSKSIEKYKKELDEKTREFQLKLDFDLEKHKDKLNFETFKAIKLHEQRLKVILELHKKLLILNRNMLEMTSILKEIHTEDPEQEEVDRIKKAGAAYNDFMTYFLEKSIFLNKELENKLEQIRNDYFDSYSDYTFGREFGIQNEFTYEKSKEASKRVRNKISVALEDLKSNFRNILGVN